VARATRIDARRVSGFIPFDQGRRGLARALHRTHDALRGYRIEARSGIACDQPTVAATTI